MKNYPKSIFDKLRKIELRIKELETYLKNPENIISTNKLEKNLFITNREYYRAVWIHNSVVAQKKYLERQIQEYII